jgi:hypothetical protein
MAKDVAIHCPKCGAPMEQGFVVDMGYGETRMANKYVSRWAPGPPEKSFFFGTRLPKGVLPVGTYRCSTCGYLESYAGPEFAAKGRTQFSLRELFLLMTVVALVLTLVIVLVRR